jgi:hypothetical protein
VEKVLLFQSRLSILLRTILTLSPQLFGLSFDPVDLVLLSLLNPSYLCLLGQVILQSRKYALSLKKPTIIVLSLIPFHLPKMALHFQIKFSP